MRCVLNHTFETYVLKMMVGIVCLFLLLAGCANAKSYDYYANNDCLPEPLSPQYKGGIVYNPTFDHGTYGWTEYAGGQIAQKMSKSGNKFLVYQNRTEQNSSPQQVFSLKKDVVYTFSAWVQIQTERDYVSAVMTDIRTGNRSYIGTAIAKPGCWSFIKGGFQVNETMNVPIAFKVNNTVTDLWIDNVSLQPFTKKQWDKQRRESVEKNKMKGLVIHVRDVNGKAIQGAQINLKETKPRYPIGASTTESILDFKGYQDWFTARFPVVSFNNQMKWYYTTTPKDPTEHYTVTDRMVEFFEQHGIGVRGHNIFWDNPGAVPKWVMNLTRDDTLPQIAVLNASVTHLKSLVSRYAGRLIAWDVINENMHYDFYDTAIGPYASAMYHQMVHQMDPKTPLFLNEFNILGGPGDLGVVPPVYIEKINQIRSFPGNKDLTVGIGIQGHIPGEPNLGYMRAALDIFGTTKMPIWITELEMSRGPHRVEWLEDVMRETFSHPAVEGIIVWGGWRPEMCNATCMAAEFATSVPYYCGTCLMDSNYTSTSIGRVVEKLMSEWKTTNVTGVTDMKGDFGSKLFKGEYSVTITHPKFPNTLEKKITVAGEGPRPVEVSFYL